MFFGKTVRGRQFFLQRRVAGRHAFFLAGLGLIVDPQEASSLTAVAFAADGLIDSRYRLILKTLRYYR